MHKDIVIVGLNHRSAPIEVRESVAVENSYVREALSRLRELPSIHEGVILSTCNRVEVVATASDHFAAFTSIKNFLGEPKAHRVPGPLEEHMSIPIRAPTRCAIFFVSPPVSTRWSSASRKFSAS